jgi:hypothetical protein
MDVDSDGSDDDDNTALRLRRLEEQLRRTEDQRRRDLAKHSEQQAMLQQLVNQAQNFQERTKAQTDEIAKMEARRVTGKDLRQILKPRQPGPFNGDSKKIRNFLTQVRNYQAYYPTILSSDKEKVRHAASCLEGAAAAWFEPTLRDFVNNSYDFRKFQTTEIFGDYTMFEQALLDAFGAVDK